MRIGIGTLTAIGLVLGAGSIVVGQAVKRDQPLTTTANKEWPAPVAQNQPEDPPALAPADAVKTITMPPGWHLELVASEPLVQDPILAEFDGNGRLWVLEMRGFANGEAMVNTTDPINNLVVLEDTNNDGVYDKRTVFADKLVLPRAFKVLANNCALVGAPPKLLKICDTNGDLVADSREEVADDFLATGGVEHGANGLYWGMDNNIYVSEHDWNLSTRGGKFVRVPTPRRGQWGVTQDDEGRIFRNVNTNALQVDYVPGPYYARNPDLVRTRGLYEFLQDQAQTNIWPARPTRGVNRGYRQEVTRPDGSSSYYQGVSSPMIYRGDRLPKELYGQAFVVDGPTNIVHLLRLQSDADGNLKATDWYPKGEFIASTDERFRPVSLTPGYDGSFLVIDMYRGVSQDSTFQTDYLRQYIKDHKLWEDIHYGRIYRVVHDGMTADQKPHMLQDSTATLVTYLSHPNGWWRDTAQQLIVQRGDQSVVPALRKLAQSAPDWRTRLQALWTMDGLGAIQRGDAERALADPSAGVRTSAVRLAEPFLGQNNVRTALLKLIDDPNAGVRRQLAATLGQLPANARVAPLVTLLLKHGDDPIVVDAATSGLRGQEQDAIVQLLRQPNPPTDPVQMLAASLGKGRNTGAVVAMIDLATKSSTAPAVRQVLLSGLNGGIRGETFSGGGGQDVEGGRAGGGIPGFVRQGPAPKPLDLAAEPAALLALAQGSGPEAEAAKQLGAVLGWPGKPEAVVEQVKRTPQQEALFAKGEQEYNTLCAGCHMPNGEGAPSVAAALAGSELVNANPSVPVRILLSGMEGSIGLMPPLGANMSDEELAAVLTFVRGSFGNNAAPVAPAQVDEYRKMYSYQKNPWEEKDMQEAAKPARR